MLAGVVFATTVAAWFLNGEEIMQSYDPYSSDPEAMLAAMGPLMLGYFAVWLIICGFFAFLNWRVFSKAGYPGAIGLVWLALAIPLLNILAALAIVVIWTWFAFAKWPALNNNEPKSPHQPV